MLPLPPPLLLPVQEEKKDEDLAVLHAAMLDDNRCREETLSSLRRGKDDAWGESERAGERGKTRFGVGDMVDARYLGGKDWFPAKITKVGRRNMES